MKQNQKPFLKWVGGKTQILDRLLPHFPKEIWNYHEPFVGGGSVLLAVLSLQKKNETTIHNKIYAYDLNERLIRLYIDMQQNVEELFEGLDCVVQEYSCLQGSVINRKPKTMEDAITSKESYFYWVRDCFNQSDVQSIESSVLFLFLNKTCFRGMYREGPNGFNVPFGHYKCAPTFLKDEFLKISDLIKDVEFIHCDFASSLAHAKTGDFVYLDPPYAPEKDKSFVGYTQDGFSLNTHLKLFKEVEKLNEKHISFSMSNAKVELVMQNCKQFMCEDVIARRAINSKKPGSTTTEVIICNTQPPYHL
ncbi:S-adenosyl-L-methionine-dependent methyltransferase [Ochromonadaceae sp. CCMP2298]|nr:S-adenosyl-L-methionine-dependent methyltransferase [Ochromonadaceae sp. CCMP2298]